jgi:hypothetical protein
MEITSTFTPGAVVCGNAAKLIKKNTAVKAKKGLKQFSLRILAWEEQVMMQGVIRQKEIACANNIFWARAHITNAVNAVFINTSFWL